MKYITTVKGQEYTIEIDADRGILIDDQPYEIDFRRLPSGGVTSLLMNNRSVAAVVEERSDHWEVLIEGELYSVQVQDERAYRLSRMRTSGLSVDGEAIVTSPMPGIIVAVPVAVGDVVVFGQKVVILESMKMENELRAPCAGVVTHVHVSPGASVEKDQPLVGISQEDTEEKVTTDYTDFTDLALLICEICVICVICGSYSSRSVMNSSGGDPSIEVEVKFLVDDLDALRRRLVAAGAVAGAPRVYERNVRFDTADERLLAREALLRLRQDTRVRLTYKGLSDQDAASEAKIREEIELTIEEFDRMALIFDRLGFHAVQTYEKYRTTFHLGDVEVVLDEMPFGAFVELEGPADVSLKAVAEALGLDWSRRVLTNYLELMERCRRAFDLPFNDLTFANFERRPVDMGALLPRCVVSEDES